MLGSCCSSPESVYGHLVEQQALAASDFTLVVGATALLQALERLAFHRGYSQRFTPPVELELLTVQIAASGLMVLLAALEVGLTRHQLTGRGQCGAAIALLGLSLRNAVGGGLLLLFAEAVGHHRARELLRGDVFASLAEGPNAFKPETERSPGHGRLVGRFAGFFSAVDACTTATRSAAAMGLRRARWPRRRPGLQAPAPPRGVRRRR